MSGFCGLFKQEALKGTYPLATDNLKADLVKLPSVTSAMVKTITAVTNASPAVITSTSHGFTNGQRVSISGAVGLTAINGRFQVAGATSNTFTLVDIISGAAINGNGTFSGSCYAINLSTLQFRSSIDAGARASTSGNLGSKTFTLGVFSFAVITFSAVTASQTSQAVIIFDDTPSTDATKPIIGVDDQATNLPVLSNGGDITYTPHANGFGEI